MTIYISFIFAMVNKTAVNNFVATLDTSIIISLEYNPAAAAAAAKSLQSCPTLCDPIGGSREGPPSLGFSRQEHWSGLPFPSPMIANRAI